MLKKTIAVVLSWITNTVLHATTLSVFVSFSMPTKLLEETLLESARLKIPAYLNGLYHDSMPETAGKIMQLSQHIPHLNLQIDPTAFERYDIKQVPALVVEHNKRFDVIYGNLTLEEGLARIKDIGESGFSHADLRRLRSE
jgi:conjugal transfer pilus assembly protein TrbC